MEAHLYFQLETLDIFQENIMEALGRWIGMAQYLMTECE
jgi:hypothetical protein